MPRPTPRLAPVTTATRPRRSGACQVMAPYAGPRSAVQRGLLLRGRERPRRLRAPLLAEVEPQLPRRAQSVGMVGPERRARFVVIERTQEVALEVAVLARNLLRGSPNLRHAVHDLLATTPRQPERGGSNHRHRRPATRQPANAAEFSRLRKKCRKSWEFMRRAREDAASSVRFGPPDARGAPSQMNVL